MRTVTDLGRAAAVLAIMMMAAGCASSPSSPATPSFSVDSMTPSSGNATGGATVTFTGSGFTAGTTVTFGGTAATGVTVSSTRITAVLPAHAEGAVDVVVAISSTENVTLVNGFTFVTRPAPTGVSPASGSAAGGTNVTVTGSGFSGDAAVTFGGTALINLRVVSATAITGTTAAHSSGFVDVVVRNANGQTGTLTNGFSYVGQAPVITSVLPNFGSVSGGTSVVISGSGFINTTSVTFGGTPVISGTANAAGTALTVITGPHAAGLVNVVVTNADGQSVTSANAYTYR